MLPRFTPVRSTESLRNEIWRCNRLQIARCTAGLCIAVVVQFHAGSAKGADSLFHGSPDNYRQLITLLRPGDTLALSAGVYRYGLRAHNLSGEPGRPITISGPQHGPTATFIARAGHNTISIADSRYLVIRNLALVGNNLPVDAVKAEGFAHWTHDVTLENLDIRGYGNNQQTVGISTKCPAWNWILRGNTIVGAGTGMYLGNSDGNAPFVAGLIERNVIIDTIGYNLQIKHQRPRPELPGMPGGRSMTIIRHNVFAKEGAGSSESARPNVLVGHFPLEGAGVEDDYAVYGNFFYQNRHEALFQGEGNVALYSNLFVNRYGDAIRIQPHNDIPRRIIVAFNTVLAEGAGITVIRNEEGPRFPQWVSANIVFARPAIAGGTQTDNVTASLSEADTYLAQPFAPLGELDLHPSRAPVRATLAVPVPDVHLPDWDKDFDGRRRPADSIGAYGGNRTNHRWVPRLEAIPDH